MIDFPGPGPAGYDVFDWQAGYDATTSDASGQTTLGTQVAVLAYVPLATGYARVRFADSMAILPPSAWSIVQAEPFL